jgi:hypothetical protein
MRSEEEYHVPLLAFSGSPVLEVLRLTEFQDSPWTRTLRDSRDLRAFCSNKLK